MCVEGLLTIPVDYILFIQAKVDLNINPNEVRDARYVLVCMKASNGTDMRLFFSTVLHGNCGNLLISGAFLTNTSAFLT